LTFEPRIGTSSGNEIPKVSYGRGIGFHLFIKNNGTNSTPQTSEVRVTSDSATYDSSTATFNGTQIPCAANPTNSKQMVCPLPTGKLLPGDTFEAFLRFVAPTDTTIKRVSTTATLSTTAQSVEATTTTDRRWEQARCRRISSGRHDRQRLPQTSRTGHDGWGFHLDSHPQNFSLKTPTGLAQRAFGVAVGIQDKIRETERSCVGLLNFCTILKVCPTPSSPSQPRACHSREPVPHRRFRRPLHLDMDAKYTGASHSPESFTSTTTAFCSKCRVARASSTVTNPGQSDGGGSALLRPPHAGQAQQAPSRRRRGIENGGLGWN
jgi:hypothetical protein